MAYDATEDTPNRRPVAARRHPAFPALARRLQAAGVTPNAVSVASIFFAAGGGASLAATPHVAHAPAAGLFVLAERYRRIGKTLHVRHLSADCRAMLLKAGSPREQAASTPPHFTAH